MLSAHPDRLFVEYILRGIKYGLRIGFNRVQQLHLAPNRSSSHDHSELVTQHLDREVELKRMYKCPYGSKPRWTHTSPIGIIPKKNKPNKWGLIIDLSSPKGLSVNDGIATDLSSLCYTSVDHLCSIILSVGKEAQLVKADIKEAYRMVPVHPDDQPLLAVQWTNRVFIDKALPFGLRSAPKIFSALADAIQWVLCHHGITNLLHYLDDFIFVAKTSADTEAQKCTLVDTWLSLGVPLEL